MAYTLYDLQRSRNETVILTGTFTILKFIIEFLWYN